MTRDVETFVQSCTGCQYSDKSKSTKPIPVGTFPAPEKPGELYNLDIAGPFHNGHYLVALVDAMSNFPEVLDTKDTTSSKIIKWLMQMWSRNGLPTGLITDNGPQFISDEFEKFLDSLDIHHHTTAVYNPMENGRVEVFNRTLKHGVQAISAEGTAWEEGVNQIITAFRHTPGPDVKTPAEKFFGRSIRRHGMINLEQPYRRINTVQREQKRGHFQVGDQVLIKLPQVHKGLPPFSGPLEVQEVLSFFTFRLNNGKVYNARRLKLYRKRNIEHNWIPEEEQPKPMEPEQQLAPPEVRRSSRATRGVPPARYRDCCTSKPATT